MMKAPSGQEHVVKKSKFTEQQMAFALDIFDSLNTKNDVSTDSGQLQLHCSLIGMPASACLRKPMICSSVNLLFFMSVILLVVDGLH